MLVRFSYNALTAIILHLPNDAVTKGHPIWVLMILPYIIYIQLVCFILISKGKDNQFGKK